MGSHVRILQRASCGAWTQAMHGRAGRTTAATANDSTEQRAQQRPFLTCRTLCGTCEVWSSPGAVTEISEAREADRVLLAGRPYQNDRVTETSALRGTTEDYYQFAIASDCSFDLLSIKSCCKRVHGDPQY